MAYTDSFTGVDSTTLESHNAAWVSVGGATGEITISSNQITGAAPVNSFGAYYYNQTFSSKHYSQVVFATSNSGNGGPALRVQSGDNFYYFSGFAGDKLYPGESIAGSYTDWDSGIAVPAADSVLRAEVDATTETTIIVKDDGLTIQTYTSKSNLSGGRPGVCQWGNLGENDDWEGGDVSAAPADINASASESVAVADTGTADVSDPQAASAEAVSVADSPSVSVQPTDNAPQVSASEAVTVADTPAVSLPDALKASSAEAVTVADTPIVSIEELVDLNALFVRVTPLANYIQIV